MEQMLLSPCWTRMRHACKPPAFAGALYVPPLGSRSIIWLRSERAASNAGKSLQRPFQASPMFISRQVKLGCPKLKTKIVFKLVGRLLYWHVSLVESDLSPVCCTSTLKVVICCHRNCQCWSHHEAILPALLLSEINCSAESNEWFVL